MFGGADRDRREHDFGTLQPLWCAGLDITTVQLNLRSELAQPINVKVDRTRTDGAAAW